MTALITLFLVLVIVLSTYSTVNISQKVEAQSSDSQPLNNIDSLPSSIVNKINLSNDITAHSGRPEIATSGNNVYVGCKTKVES